MILGLECKKVKGTGFIPAVLGGGTLAAAVPVLNMAVRTEIYTGACGSPVQILMNANWQLMAMLNILLAVAGACLMYHTEHTDNALQRMRTLPFREYKLFLGKVVLMLLMCIMILILEAAAVTFCISHWFELSSDTAAELLRSFGYALLLMLPAAFSSLLIASICKNLWAALGIGVVCVSAATMLPADNFALSLFPFALPFQIYAGTAEHTVIRFLTAGITEIAIIVIVEMSFLKIRRWFA